MNNREGCSRSCLWTGSSGKPSGDWPREMRGTALTARACRHFTACCYCVEWLLFASHGALPCAFYSLLLLRWVTAIRKSRRSALCRPVDTICPYLFPCHALCRATELFFPPVFRFGRHSVFGHRILRLFSKFFFRLVVLQHVSASVAVRLRLRRGSCCCCCPDFDVFWMFC